MPTAAVAKKADMYCIMNQTEKEKRVSILRQVGARVLSEVLTSGKDWGWAGRLTVEPGRKQRTLQLLK